jgi:sporulation protein YlmC with PRC-barrel domain
MPNPIDVGGVVGTDNVSPIYNPAGRWQCWNMDEVYLGDAALGKYVPKVGDLIFEITGGRIIRFIVKDINPSTMVPMLEQEDVNSSTGLFTNDDILVGVGPGQQSDTYRVYVDKSVTPYRLSVDARLSVAGSMCRTCKIFKGADVGINGTVISRMFNANGLITSENIPLELAYAMEGNRTIRTVSPAYTTADLKDGELVTAVFYDDAGFVVSKRQLLVENTAFIRSAQAPVRLITGISMKTPFLSTTNQKLIEYPINFPMNGLNLMGVVHYSNGETREYPVDGGKFTLFGFEEYVATQVGQHLNLVLKYSLGPEEAHVVGTVLGGDRFITERYEAVTLNADGTYGVKLYAYPVWMDSVNGYRLTWYLYNLSRDTWYDVTPNVRINAVYAPYNPIAYGQTQRLSVSLNLKEVNGIYKNYVHTQTIDIVIARQGTERQTNWLIGYSPDQNPKYGVDTYATAKFVGLGHYQVKVNCGLSSQSQWLDRLYYNTKPLYNPSTENGPLTPTHFVLMVNGLRSEYPIGMWNSPLVVNQNVRGSTTTAYVQFVRKSGANEFQLSIAGLPVWEVDNNDTIIV